MAAVGPWRKSPTRAIRGWAFGSRGAAAKAADERGKEEDGVVSESWRKPPTRGSRSWRTLHAVPLVRYTQIATPPAVLGPLARAARSFAPRYTQLRHGARSFFPDPREGPPRLPARLMLHAVFGASETACSVPHLRVAWRETACSVPHLRVAWRETACSVPHLRVAWTETACTVPRLRVPCAGGRARTQRPPHPLPCHHASKPRSRLA